MTGRVRSKMLQVAVLVLLLSGSGLVSAGDRPAAPVGNCRYFIATGHYVCEEFLTFYESRDGDVLLGQPVTEAYVDPRRGMLIQVFQNGLLEWRPQADGSEGVQIGAVVDELGYGYARLEFEDVPRFRTALRRYYPESGHTVSYAFLDFFRAHGGTDTFGLPISEPMTEDGRTVQYFQRFRMEWHPEAEPRPEVRLSKLAAANLDRLGVPLDVRSPLAAPPSAVAADGEPVRSTVRQIVVSPSVARVVLGQGDRQTVHTYVTDQQGSPVEGATVDFVIRFADEPLEVRGRATDGTGHTGAEFDVADAPRAGTRVVIDVVAQFGDLLATTQTFFLVWH